MASEFTFGGLSGEEWQKKDWRTSKEGYKAHQKKDRRTSKGYEAHQKKDWRTSKEGYEAIKTTKQNRLYKSVYCESRTKWCHCWSPVERPAAWPLVRATETPSQPRRMKKANRVPPRTWLVASRTTSHRTRKCWTTILAKLHRPPRGVRLSGPADPVPGRPYGSSTRRRQNWSWECGWKAERWL